MTLRTVVFMVLAMSVLGGSAAARQSVAPVRELYLAADYESALAALDEMPPVEPGSDTSLIAERLRAFCLLALDRGDEAEAVIARIVTAHPAYQPGDDVSPRIRLVFRVQRDRHVPAMARRLYDEGRIAFDRGEYDAALDRFGRALPVIELLALEGRAGMEDLRVLANGFLALARERLPSPPPPPLAARGWPIDPLPLPPPVAIRPDVRP